MSQILADQAMPRKKEKTRTTIVKTSTFKRDSFQDMSDPGKLQNLIDESQEYSKPPLLENFEELNSEISKLNEWNLDVWAIKLEKEKFKLIWAMFHAFNFFEKIELDQNRFSSFLNVIHDKYNVRNNPFHNFDHGFTGFFFYFKKT